MKKLFFASLAAFVSLSGNAQGWVGNSSTNSIYSVNSSLGLSPLNVGIGTNAPNEQLHTTSGVRFAGLTNDNTLTRILAQDGGGKLFWRDYSTFNQGNFWGLTGNTGTNPAVNYLGTTDGNRLVFGTVGQGRATILTNGYFGIGIPAPGARLHVYDGTPKTGTFMPLNIYETGVFEGERDTNRFNMRLTG